LAVALLPVAAIEAVVYLRRLSIPGRQAWWGALRANLWSTFAGVPLAWLAQTVAQFALGGATGWGLETPLDRIAAVTVQSAWLVPYESDLSWMVPAAALFLLLP